MTIDTSMFDERIRALREELDITYRDKLDYFKAWNEATAFNRKLIATLELVEFGLTTDAENNNGKIDVPGVLGTVQEALKEIRNGL